MYFTGFPDFTRMEAQFNGNIYVFKYIEVAERMYLGMDEGFIWVGQIKCYLAGPDQMRRFKPGDRVDILGRNDGPTSYSVPGLKFTTCYVLSAGSVILPSASDPNAITSFVPAY
jgi:hypothetical protein